MGITGINILFGNKQDSLCSKELIFWWDFSMDIFIRPVSHLICFVSPSLTFGTKHREDMAPICVVNK